MRFPTSYPIDKKPADERIETDAEKQGYDEPESRLHILQVASRAQSEDRNNDKEPKSRKRNCKQILRGEANALFWLAMPNDLFTRCNLKCHIGELAKYPGTGNKRFDTVSQI